MDRKPKKAIYPHFPANDTIPYVAVVDPSFSNLPLSEFLKSKERFITQYKELVDAINRNAKRLKQLTADILDVARIESELLTLRRTHFNLRQVILDTISDHKSQIANGEYSGLVERKEVTLELRSDMNADNNILVYSDEGRRTQVLSF